MAAAQANVVMAVDVGTASARAGLFDADGRMLGRATHPIAMHRPAPDHAEHGSDDIWQAVGEAARGALARAGIAGEEVAGVSFDATCSLVFRDGADRPLGISTSGGERWDTIVWLDHRALAEAEEATATGHAVLDHIGGVMSPEMQVPKLMWVKRHRPTAWAWAGRIADLADHLAWRASGANDRSTCTITCKWTYLAYRQPGWQADFLGTVGLADLPERARLPAVATPVGARVGRLTPAAAANFGLTTQAAVGAGLIDAHAGALGVLGTALGDVSSLNQRIALIAGTSSCHMALSPDPCPVPGVWGPYLGAVAPGLWLNEGGQSATGALLDHVLALHAEGRPLGAAGHERVLARIAELRAAGQAGFAAGLHVLPDFHGNRSPLADPHARGVVSGLTLDGSFDGMCRLYYASALAIALGTRHILAALDAKGYAIRHLHLTGGHARAPLLVELYADATGCTVELPGEEDGVLLGTAMVAATAAGLHPDLPAAAAAMARPGRTVAPDPARRALFDRRYRALLAMHGHRRELDRIMAGAA